MEFEELQADKSDKATDAKSPIVVVRPPLKAPPRIRKDGEHHFVVTGNVIAPDEFNYDWTNVTEIRAWQFLTQKRYDMMKECVLVASR